MSAKMSAGTIQERYRQYILPAILCGLLAAFVFFAVMLLFEVGAKAATITVDDSGGQQYSSIQAAVNAASPGDVIYVRDGVYSEWVSINKALTLSGESTDGVVLKGNSVYGNTGLYITASGAVVKNIRIDGFYIGVRIFDVSSGNISYVKITNSARYGVCISSSEGIAVTSSAFDNNGWDNIYAESSSDIQIWSNTLTNSSWDNIYLSVSSNNVVSSNNILNSGGAGVYLDTASDNVITSNVVALNSGASTTCGGIGIYLDNSSNNVFTSNIIYDTSAYGLYLRSGTGNTAIHNWWGSESGPHNDARNPNGTGVNISDGVPFEPWLLWPFGAPKEAPRITTPSCTNFDGNYTIGWTAVENVTNYILKENGANIYDGTKLVDELSGKLVGVLTFNYTYTVSAHNPAGTSPESAPVTITVVNPSGISQITTPGGMDADGNYSINWTSVPYASGYELSENGVIVYSGAALTLAFSGKLDKSTYTYIVTAYNSIGRSLPSNATTISVLYQKAPKTPTIASLGHTIKNGTYDVCWIQSEYASSYELFEDGVLVYNGSALFVSFAGKPNGTYKYAVRARNENGTSQLSTHVDVHVVDIPTTPMITTKDYTDADGNYSINWTHSTFALGYELSVVSLNRPHN